ncbi:MAG: hypothetical protein DRQ10_06685 [Candidatus Hydrothermota bacterium]|nr:MAG: hypothetical protein DRQ10_06685 [Candidatus Hydrothermae bacterium]
MRKTAINRDGFEFNLLFTRKNGVNNLKHKRLPRKAAICLAEFVYFHDVKVFFSRYENKIDTK